MAKQLQEQELLKQKLSEQIMKLMKSIVPASSRSQEAVHPVAKKKVKNTILRYLTILMNRTNKSNKITATCQDYLSWNFLIFLFQSRRETWCAPAFEVS